MDLEKLRGWLDEHGHPLEMKIALACVNAGLSVVRSEYYEDKTSGAYREVDVIASQQTRVRTSAEMRAFARCRLVVECKSSVEFPWVVFTVGRRLSNTALIAQTPASILGKRFARTLAQMPEAEEWPLFKLPPRIGYGATAGMRKTGSKDPVYDALMSLGNATAGIARRYDGNTSPSVAELCFPILVTSAPIVEASMKKDESIELKEVDSSLISWRNPLVGSPHTIIRLVEKDAFPQLAAQAKQSFDSILDVFERKRLTTTLAS